MEVQGCVESNVAYKVTLLLACYAFNEQYIMPKSVLYKPSAQLNCA